MTMEILQDYTQDQFQQNEGLTCLTPQGQTLRVREVWADNLYQEIKYIRDIVDQYPYIAMDTEFPGIVAKPVGEFRTMGQYQYQALRINVNMLLVIQIGLTFFDKNGELPQVEGELCCWQFNFREFHPSQHMYAQDSLDLLKTSGIDFELNARKGINVKDFAELLMCSGVVLNEEVKWVTFHSSYDFGYLLKVLTQQPLPESEEDFFNDLEIYFPTFYDIKYLIKFCNNLHGGLNYLAKLLNVQRYGPCHQAGSDSLLTSTTFIKLAQTYFNNEEDEVQKYSGVLYGLGQDGKQKYNEKSIQAFSGQYNNQKLETRSNSSDNQLIDNYANSNTQLLLVKS